MADKNGEIAETPFSTDMAAGDKIIPKHILELRKAIEVLSTYDTKVDNCGNCVYCETCQKCQTCQGCQSQNCQGCQSCQKCQTRQNQCDCNCSDGS